MTKRFGPVCDKFWTRKEVFNKTTIQKIISSLPNPLCFWCHQFNRVTMLWRRHSTRSSQILIPLKWWFSQWRATVALLIVLDETCDFPNTSYLFRPMLFAVNSVSSKPKASPKSQNLELSLQSSLSTEWTVLELRLNWATAVLPQGTPALNRLRVPGLFVTKVTPNFWGFLFIVWIVLGTSGVYNNSLPCTGGADRYFIPSAIRIKFMGGVSAHLSFLLWQWRWCWGGVIAYGDWGPGFDSRLRHKYFSLHTQFLLQFLQHPPWTPGFSICLSFLYN